MHSTHGKATLAARRPVRRLAGALLGLALLGGLALPALSGAAAGFADGGAGTTLIFTRDTAPRVGSTALLAVRCLGPRSASCNGTVTISVGPRRTKVPFAVGAGAQQSLAVPVAGRSPRGFAVARTAQASGGQVRETALIEFR